MIYYALWLVLGLIIGIFAQIKGRNSFLFGIVGFFAPLIVLVIVILIPEKQKETLNRFDEIINNISIKSRSFHFMIILMRKSPSFSKKLFNRFDFSKPYQIETYIFYTLCCIYSLWIILLLYSLQDDSNGAGQGFLALVMLILIGTGIAGVLLLVFGIYLKRVKDKRKKDLDVKRSKSINTIKDIQNDTWTCICGVENNMDQLNCRSCTKFKTLSPRKQVP